MPTGGGMPSTSAGATATGAGVGGSVASMGGGGASTGGAETGGAEVGGNATGGAGTAGASAGMPAPSPGCGTANNSPQANLSNTIVSFPNGYDGLTPVPMVMAFHAAGNPNTQLEGILGGTLKGEYIMVYPKSAGNEWNANADRAKVDDIYDEFTQNHCVDMNRIFATGHSSGAQFVVQMLCAGEDRWRGVAPVASSVYCNSWDPIPALVIHGANDSERQAFGLNDGDGRKDLQVYLDSNGCSMDATPVEIDAAGCGSNIDPGCRDYEGCSQPTRWCNHNDPQYSGTNHGVPCFAAAQILEFFDSLR